MVARIIIIMMAFVSNTWNRAGLIVIVATFLSIVSAARAVSLKDLVARISAESMPAASVIGGAVDLDGSEYLSDGVSGYLSGATSVTIAVWVKPAIRRSYMTFISSRGASFSSLNTADSTNTWHARFYAATTSFATSGAAVIALGEWSYVVGTWARSNAPTIYLNAVGYNNGTVKNTAFGHDDFYRIGTDDFSTANRTTIGVIDDISVWRNRALSDAEIVELYNGGVGKPVTSLSTGTNGLVRYWKLDDGLSDSSATQALDTVSGTYAIGTAIGSGDWTNGIVPQ